MTVLALWAGSYDHGMISFPGRVSWALATPAKKAVDPNPENLVTLFSNFGGPNNLYEKNVSWDVAGPHSGVQRQWVAMPFTLARNAEVTRIAVAVEHNTGSPNSFVLSLNEDDGGQIPGNAIHTWIVKNAPEFGTCCVVDLAKDAKGLRVNAGTQYWVVARLDAEQDETRMEWDLSPQGIEGNFAFNNGLGWFEYTAFTSAFAVYGREPTRF